MSAQLSIDNPVFKSFIGYAVVLIVKVLFMSFITAHHRISKKIFATDEDYVYFKSIKKPTADIESVERVRRAHQNDLENIIPFLLLSLLYITTGPSISTALLHFRVFTGTRILHTIVYLLQVPQPARGLTYFTGQIVTWSLAFQIIKLVAF